MPVCGSWYQRKNLFTEKPRLNYYSATKQLIIWLSRAFTANVNSSLN